MDEYLLMGYVFGSWRRRAAESLLVFGITFHQFQLVRLVRRRGGLSLSSAAYELGMDRPSLTLVARKCIQQGWIERSPSALDRRSFRLLLSGKGEELLDRIETAQPFLPESLGDAFDVLGSEERAELRRMLDKAARRARDLYR
ncbi:MAG: MarR family transcriptional regulator [Spirochaetes bacterium]|nr:MarR family transcriptional regulator [Spirochaetota bacterium]